MLLRSIHNKSITITVLNCSVAQLLMPRTRSASSWLSRTIYFVYQLLQQVWTLWCSASSCCWWGCQSTPGNIGNIPLVIIGAICCDNEDNPFGMDPEASNSQGVAYISFGQWVCMYTFFSVQSWVLDTCCRQDRHWVLIMYIGVCLGFGLYNKLRVSLFQVLPLFVVFSELLSPHMMDVLWRMCQVQAIVPCKGACGVSQVGCSQKCLNGQQNRHNGLYPARSIT